MGISVLGPPQVDGGGALAPRDRAVLAALVVRRGQIVMPDLVADAVWGEQLPASWPTQVQICIARLRKALGADAIETVSGGYRLSLNGDEIDADRFEHLLARGRALAATGEPDRAAATFDKALNLWRGRPFEDLNGWEPASSEAVRLEELRRSAEEDLADTRLAAGAHREVAATAEGLVAAEPLRERRWAILALAQYRCGRQADALRTLARARRLLREQLGIDPGPDLVELEAAILRQDEALAAPPAAPAAISADCPYKGLAAYEAGDADLFFGRNGDVAACLERLQTSPLLVVAGPSGCGKSSLVRAGLMPALARRGRAACVVVPGADPSTALGDALAASEPAVLIVDQFEELFAAGREVEFTAEFLQELTRCARHRAPVVICVRADHLPGLSVDTEFARLAEQGLYLLGPLRGDQLRAAIEQPAAQAGLRLEAGLVDLLVRDCEDEPGGLPLLSHALAETWRRRDGNVLTVEGYRDSGGIRGAVARSADRLYDGLSADQRVMLRGVLLRLVTPSVEGDPVRSRVPMRSLVGDREREHVVALLVRARLLTAEADTVELAHEALARAWPRLQAWLDEDAAGLRVLRHLTTAAAGWDSLGRPDSELYRGARLDTALEWRTSTNPDLTDVEAEFLEASVALAESERTALEARARRDARQNRRLRGALIGVALLAVASLIAGLVAVQQRDRAEDERRAAELASLVNNSVALRGPRPELAALLAVEAHRLDPSASTESALLGLFTAAPGMGPRITLEGGELSDPPVMLADGTTAAVPGLDATVRLIDVETGRITELLGEPVDGASTWLATSADGRALAAAISVRDEDGGHTTLRAWDLATGQLRLDDVAVPFESGSIALNADGTQVAIAGGFEGRTQVYDATSGALVRELDPVPRPDDARMLGSTVAVAYASDGSLIVTSQAGPVRWFDPLTGEEIGRTEGANQTSEWGVYVAGDGVSMITYGTRGVMRYALPSGEPLWADPVDRRCDFLSAPVEALNAVLCLSAARMLALDLDTGVSLGPRFSGRGEFPLVSPDGSTLFVFSFDGTMTSWRLDGGGLVSRFLPRPDGGFVTGYSTDGQYLLVNTNQPPVRPCVTCPLTYTNPGAVEIIDADTGQVRARIDGAVEARPTEDPARLVARFADDTFGQYDITTQRRVGPTVEVDFPVQEFAVGGGFAWAWGQVGPDEGQLARIDLASGDVQRLEEAIPGLFRVSVPTADQLVTLADDGINAVLQRRDPNSGAVAAELPGVAQAGVGERTIVAATWEGDLLAVEAGGLVPDPRRFPAPDVFFERMELSDDEQRMLALGEDNQVRLYDVAARTQLGTEIPSEAPARATGLGWLTSAALLGDGLAAATSTDGGIVVWDLDPARWSEAACELASRNLTREEWETYIGDLASYRATCPQFDSET